MSEIAQPSLTPNTGDTLTCPWCGKSGGNTTGLCDVCGRTILNEVPPWAQVERDRRFFSRRRMIMGGVALMALLIFTWLNYPFLPDFKILLFNHPTTELSSTSMAGQWSMAGGDIAQHKVIESPTTQPTGQVRWAVALGENSRSGPVVSDGRVYLGGHFKVSALDTETGETLWEQPTTGPVQSSLAAAGDLLFMGLQDHWLLALDPATGETLWKFKAGDIITSAPAVHQGIVYFGSWDSNVYALDAATGKSIWTYKTTGAVGVQTAIEDGILAVGDRNGRMHLLNARTGQNRLVFRTPKSSNTAAVMANGLVYFPAGGRLYVINANEKEIPGQYQFKRVWAQFWLWQTPGVPRPPGQQGGRWRYSPDGADSSIVAGPAVTPTMLYVGDLKGGLYAINAVNSDDVWQFQAEGGIFASPIVAGNRVYIGTQRGHVYALDGDTGQLHWQLELGSPINQPMAFANGRLYVRTSDGVLHTLE